MAPGDGVMVSYRMRVGMMSRNETSPLTLLVFDSPSKKQFYDDVVELILEVVMDTRESIMISGNEIPTEIVRSRLLKLDSEHIGYVETSLSKTTTDIKNIKKYLLSALYNAPVTMESYYDAWVKHDMAAETEKGT